jgi:hypothetical protein
MNIIQKIANSVERRLDVHIKNGLAAKGKRIEDLNYELWCGAYAGIEAAEGEASENAQWVNRVVFIAIGTRGVSETRKIARDGRDADRLVEVEAEKEADIDRVFNLVTP